LSLLAVASACCAPVARPQSDQPARAPREDAEPEFLSPNEVDAPPRLLTPIEPTYPRGMRIRGQEGDVTARVLVRADGSVAGAELIETTHPQFSAAVREVIRAARFAPALRAGRPVAAWVTLRVRFRLA